LSFAFMLSLSSAVAQRPWLMSDEMPDAIRFLPAPPDSASDAFKYDVSQYRWGKEQRLDSARLAIAVRDAVWSVETICHEFSAPFGVEISEANTPEIHKLLLMSLITTDQVGKKPKDYFFRTRPYVFFDEPTIYPGDEKWLRTNGSYPSGHTILGWSAALLLTELNPSAADTIMARGYIYGQSRVIAGYHWQSDVDAARLAASAAVARLHADKRFAKQMKKAKREFARKVKTNAAEETLSKIESMRGKVMSVAEADDSHVPMSEMEKIYNGHMPLPEAELSATVNSYTSKLLAFMRRNSFSLGQSTHLSLRIYCQPDGSADCCLYRFMGHMPFGAEVSRFEELMHQFLKDNPVPLKRDYRFAFRCPLSFTEGE